MVGEYMNKQIIININDSDFNFPQNGEKRAPQSEKPFKISDIDIRFNDELFRHVLYCRSFMDRAIFFFNCLFYLCIYISGWMEFGFSLDNSCYWLQIRLTNWQTNRNFHKQFPVIRRQTHHTICFRLLLKIFLWLCYNRHL